MQRNSRTAWIFLGSVALFLSACSEKPAAEAPAIPASHEPPAPAANSPAPIAGTDNQPAASEPVPPTESGPVPPVDPAASERRYFAAPNDPTARIAAIRELANATPAASLALLNRVFPIERREDVKSEMLAILGDLDHTRDRDQQLALCTKALAPNQPQRVRYIAIHTMADLHDPRARAFLLPLQNDPDREIRTAATQVLSDLPQ